MTLPYENATSGEKALGEICFDHTETQKEGSHFLLRVPFDGEPVHNDAHSAVKLDAAIDEQMAAGCIGAV